MAARTTTQAGLWSASSTWGGNPYPAAGDTASIGHNVTDDVGGQIGTSPNDNTTKAIDVTAAVTITVAAGVSRTVNGNVGGVNGSTLQLNAGSTWTFDASASGGTPVYRFINVGGWKFTTSGTSGGSRARMESVAGYTFGFSGAWWMSATYLDVARCSSLSSSNSTLPSLDFSITNATFDNCSTFDITFASASLNFTLSDVTFTNSTNSTDSFKLSLATARTGGSRIVRRVVADKQFNNLVKNMTEFRNCVLGGITCYIGGTTSFDATPHDIFLGSTLNLNGGDGMKMVDSWARLYVAREGTAGNPHFLGPYTVSGDAYYDQCVFESQQPDLVDTGDCFMLKSTCCAAGTKVVARNCIVLPSGYSGATVTSGQLLTSYNPPATNSTHQSQFYRCTANQNKSGATTVRACLAVAEGATGAANQVSAVNGNIGWASATGNGYFAERISGTVVGHITPAGVVKNWIWNLDAGDNGLAFRDRANSPARGLWVDAVASGGEAAAQGITHAGTTDPQFVDSTRNVAKWATARGYGGDYAAGKAALQADPTRVSDLIDYVFAGFKPQNASCRTASHDGTCVGAANWHDSTRSLSTLNSMRAYLAAKYPTLA